uniref:Uncharacterized protein n=1 Tax=Candidatus Kentrum sp. MB TaxID=2138164 RepID=A0A450XQ50_9GAMM|nr:MAG: hypothetical protein BECKMB1821I_GA0114274_102210 [Candidatus Kentron sp. MB]VFK75434.1 MAG: hypothetical protein BECKMB1821H_GA0114242_102210 [Candidatus Kentron sp. MB]
MKISIYKNKPYSIYWLLVIIGAVLVTVFFSRQVMANPTTKEIIIREYSKPFSVKFHDKDIYMRYIERKGLPSQYWTQVNGITLFYEKKEGIDSFQETRKDPEGRGFAFISLYEEICFLSEWDTYEEVMSKMNRFPVLNLVPSAQNGDKEWWFKVNDNIRTKKGFLLKVDKSELKSRPENTTFKEIVQEVIGKPCANLFVVSGKNEQETKRVMDDGNPWSGFATSDDISDAKNEIISLVQKITENSISAKLNANEGELKKIGEKLNEISTEGETNIWTYLYQIQSFLTMALFAMVIIGLSLFLYKRYRSEVSDRALRQKTKDTITPYVRDKFGKSGDYRDKTLLQMIDALHDSLPIQDKIAILLIVDLDNKIRRIEGNVDTLMIAGLKDGDLQNPNSQKQLVITGNMKKIEKCVEDIYDEYRDVFSRDCDANYRKLLDELATSNLLPPQQKISILLAIISIAKMDEIIAGIKGGFSNGQISEFLDRAFEKHLHPLVLDNEGKEKKLSQLESEYRELQKRLDESQRENEKIEEELNSRKRESDKVFQELQAVRRKCFIVYGDLKENDFETNISNLQAYLNWESEQALWKRYRDVLKSLHHYFLNHQEILVRGQDFYKACGLENLQQSLDSYSPYIWFPDAHEKCQNPREAIIQEIQEQWRGFISRIFCSEILLRGYWYDECYYHDEAIGSRLKEAVATLRGILESLELRPDDIVLLAPPSGEYEEDRDPEPRDLSQQERYNHILKEKTANVDEGIVTYVRTWGLFDKAKNKRHTTTKLNTRREGDFRRS